MVFPTYLFYAPPRTSEKSLDLDMLQTYWRLLVAKGDYKSSSIIELNFHFLGLH